MHNFKKLRAWDEGRVLANDVYRITKAFPKEDRQILSAQLRRAVLAISANIAEGCGKESRAEMVRFLQIAAGSASETEHHLIVAADLGFMSPEESAEYAERAAKIQRMIRALCRKLPP